MLGVGVVFAVAAAPAAAPAVLPRGTFGTAPAQCANRESGPSNPINDCTGSAWINGNLNSNKSLYREGDFVPFRTPITGVVAGRTYSIRIGYDAVEDGLHAYISFNHVQVMPDAMPPLARSMLRTMIPFGKSRRSAESPRGVRRGPALHRRDLRGAAARTAPAPPGGPRQCR